jgi:glycosyltransferase involved in cell wall biosynthesis
MRILILGSVALPVPPVAQGGTERMAWFQANGLALRGHDVTLVAAKGSEVSPKYKLVEIGGGDTVEGSGLRIEDQNNRKDDGKGTINEGNNTNVDLAGQINVSNNKIELLNIVPEITETSRKLRKEAVYWAQVSQWMLDHKDTYDIILNNMRGAEATLLPIAKIVNKPFVNVMHLPIFKELADQFAQYDAHIVTISNAQRKLFSQLNYAGTIYNGIEVDQFTFSAKSAGYLLMMGSIAPHKNQKAGIEIAKKMHKKLILAGKISNKQYHESEILPQIDGEQIVHIGEIGFDQKVQLFGGAEALLFPITWEEPFGLVMIEAMACGTPVVAYAHGAIPEVVNDGVSGFIVNEKDTNGTKDNDTNSTKLNNTNGTNNYVIKKTGLEGLIEAVSRIGEIDRGTCRKQVEEHFTVENMVDGFDRALKQILSGK